MSVLFVYEPIGTNEAIFNYFKAYSCSNNSFNKLSHSSKSSSEGVIYFKNLFKCLLNFVSFSKKLLSNRSKFMNLLSNLSIAESCFS